MTYAQYLSQFTQDGVAKNVTDAVYQGVINRSIYERIDTVLTALKAARPTTVIIYPRLTDVDLAYSMMYDLFRLDLKKRHLVPGRRNVKLSSDQLIKVLAKLDVEDLPNNVDVLQNYTTIMMTAAMLYCHKMGRRVEAKTLIEVSAEASVKSLKRAFTAAKDIFDDCRHFSRNKYDGVVLAFLDVVDATAAATAPTKPKRVC